MSHRFKIIANQWQQGSVFKVDDHPQLIELIDTEIQDGTRCITINQDCDLVHDCFQTEPYAEIMIAEIISESDLDGNKTYAKNARCLQIGCQIDNDNVVL